MGNKAEYFNLFQIFPLLHLSLLLFATHMNFTCNVLNDVFLIRHEIMPRPVQAFMSPSKHPDSTVARRNALVIYQDKHNNQRIVLSIQNLTDHIAKYCFSRKTRNAIWEDPGFRATSN